MTPANPYRVNKVFKKTGMPVIMRKEYGSGGKYVFDSDVTIPPIYATNLNYMSVKEVVEYARMYVAGYIKVLPVTLRSMPQPPAIPQKTIREKSWKNSKSLGTAYVNGVLVWGSLNKNIFYCDRFPRGTDKFSIYKAMKWCSPKDVAFRRS